MTTEIAKFKLADLGYDEFFDLELNSIGLTNSLVARVIAEHKEAYKVKGVDGEYWAKITGKQIFSATKRADYPAVGDWVAITKLDQEQAVIQNILPRKTILQKKYSDKSDAQIIATNIDVAFIIESLDRDYNLNRFERYLVLANEGGIKPAIILNKIDLVTETDLNLKIEQIKYRLGNIDTISTSAITEQGLNELTNYIISGKTYCFLGSSGVGKSSLINRLLKRTTIKTRGISDSTGKGKHTTTARSMYFLDNGGIVIDNPGTRQVGIADTGAGIETVFDEITLLANECKYLDCTHLHEPDCAVLKAVAEGTLDEAKYLNYIKLKRETEFYEMTELEKRKKDRQFGQFKKKSMEQLNEIKPKYYK
jgi:ribosome biogenesis GTPase / thiamine phosphate phosphatase